MRVVFSCLMLFIIIRPAFATPHALPNSDNPYFNFIRSQLLVGDGKFTEAATALNQALKKEETSSFLWSQKAVMEARRGDIQAAIKNSEEALRLDPKDVDALIFLGKLYAVRQRFPHAIELYRKALILEPKNEEAYNLIARESLAFGDKTTAERTLKNCILLLPESVSCLYYLGTLQYESGKYDEALKNFTLLSDLNPDQEKVLAIIGEIHLKRKNYAKALDIFSQIAQQNPDDLVAQIRVALLYYQNHQIDEALNAFQEIHKRYPKSERVNYFLGLLSVEKKQYDAAYVYFDRIPVDSKFFQETFPNQLAILREQGRFSEALKLIETKFKKQKSVVYYRLKSMVLVTEGSSEKALKILGEGLKKFKNDESLLFQRALVLEKSGLWNESRKDLEMILKINSNSIDALNFLGYTLAERGEDLPKALEYTSRAHQQNPSEGHILDSLAWVHFKMGDARTSLTLLLRALKLEPNEPTILEHLGDVYFSLKDKKHARIYYGRSLVLLRSKPVTGDEEKKQIAGIEEKLSKF